METTKTLKGVDDNVWNTFKSISARSNMPMGKMFELMVGEFEDKSRNFWDGIFNTEALLSEDEAKELNESVKNTRKEWGFR